MKFRQWQRMIMAKTSAVLPLSTFQIHCIIRRSATVWTIQPLQRMTRMAVYQTTDPDPVPHPPIRSVLHPTSTRLRLPGGAAVMCSPQTASPSLTTPGVRCFLCPPCIAFNEFVLSNREFTLNNRDWGCVITVVYILFIMQIITIYTMTNIKLRYMYTMIL